MERQKLVVCGSFNKYHREVSQTIQQFKKRNDIFEVLAPTSMKIVNRTNDYVTLEKDEGKSRAEVATNFMNKITSSDFLYVVNQNGYIGKNVVAEISHAILHGVPILKSESKEEYASEVFEDVKSIIHRFSVYMPLEKLVKDDFGISSPLAKINCRMKNLSNRAIEMLNALHPVQKTFLQNTIDSLLFDLSRS